MTEPTDSEPEDLLKWLYPKLTDRRTAIALLVEAIRVAHAQRATSWALSMKGEFIRLNAGRAEVFALFPDELHFVVDRTRVPARFGVDDQAPGLRAIPGCAVIDLSPPEASSQIEEIREGWYAAIRAGAMSASTCPYAKHHSPALLTYLRAQLDSDKLIPEPRVARNLL